MRASKSKASDDEVNDSSDGGSPYLLDQDESGEANEAQPLLQSHPEVTAAIYDPTASQRDALEKRVLRKIDRTIIPLLFVTYMLNFMDKTILSSAAVFGLREDNVSPEPHLRG